jgi:hypothetical protein
LRRQSVTGESAVATAITPVEVAGFPPPGARNLKSALKSQEACFNGRERGINGNNFT